MRLMQENAEFLVTSKHEESVHTKVVGRSELNVGIADGDAPNKEILLRLNYAITLKDAECDEDLLQYSNLYQMTLTVIDMHGIEDENHVPIEALDNYVFQILRMAIKRTQSTLSEMGMHGLQLPEPKAFKSAQVSEDLPKTKRRARKISS